MDEPMDGSTEVVVAARIVVVAVAAVAVVA